MKFQELSKHEEEIGKAVVNAAFKIHSELGPGLLERIYELCMQHELTKAGFHVKRQEWVPVIYDGIIFKEGMKLDLLVNDLVIVELKATETINPFWTAQVISYLRLTGIQLGFLINFNVPLIKSGIKRFRN